MSNDTERRALGVLSDILARQAQDYRRMIAFYGNIQSRPGFSQAPRRLLSELGFYVDTTFNYVVPHASLVVRSDEVRECTRIAIYPYGIRDDLTKLTAVSSEQRIIRTAYDPSLPGVRLLSTFPTYIVSGELNDQTYADAKTVRLIQRIVSPSQGPVYHIIINRLGNVIITASLDDQTSAAVTNKREITIDIAIESALTVARTAFEVGPPTSFIELPFTNPQLRNLSVALAKLSAAYPNIPLTFVEWESESPGVSYVWPENVAPAVPYNFTNGGWRTLNSPFDHSATDPIPFKDLLDQQGEFDVSSEVFRSEATPPAPAARALTQAAVSNIDTAGAQSVALGNYSSVAGLDRARSMSETPRHQFFVFRINATTHDANSSGSASSNVAASATATPPVPNPVGPNVFSYITGKWGDGRPY